MEVEKPVVIIPQKGNTLYSKCVQAYSRRYCRGCVTVLLSMVQPRSFTQKVSRCYDTEHHSDRAPRADQQLPEETTGIWNRFLESEVELVCVRGYIDHQCTVVITHSYNEYVFRNGTEIVPGIVAYLHCIDKLVFITFIVFIRNTRLPGASTYQLAVAARHAGACMRLYNFAVHISTMHTYIILKLTYSVAISPAMNWPINALIHALPPMAQQSTWNK